MSDGGAVFDRDYKTKTIEACAHGDWSDISLTLPGVLDKLVSAAKHRVMRIDRCLISYRAQCPINSQGIVRVQVHDTRVQQADSRQAEFVFPVTCNCNITYYGSSWSSRHEKQFPWKLCYRLEDSNIKSGVKYCNMKGELKMCSCRKADEIEVRPPTILLLSNGFSDNDVDVYHVGPTNMNPTLNRCLSYMDHRRISVDAISTIPGLSYHNSRRSISGVGNISDMPNLLPSDVKPEDSVSQTSSRNDSSLLGSLSGGQLADAVQHAYEKGKSQGRVLSELDTKK